MGRYSIKVREICGRVKKHENLGDRRYFVRTVLGVLLAEVSRLVEKAEEQKDGEEESEEDV